MGYVFVVVEKRTDLSGTAQVWSGRVWGIFTTQAEALKEAEAMVKLVNEGPNGGLLDYQVQPHLVAEKANR